MGGNDEITGAHVLVANLVAQGVRRVFHIPGAKIDRIVEVLRTTEEIELVLCRNEQSAAHMAAGHGRRTGRAGVVLVTSGPGVTNLVTAMATANCEGDPVVALGGNVPTASRYKKTHQALDNVGVMLSVTKFAVEIPGPDQISECITNAFRQAESIGRPGVAFVSLPMDLMVGPAKMHVLGHTLQTGGGHAEDVVNAAETIANAELPVLLLGMFASSPRNASALRKLLHRHPIACVATFQGAGIVPRDLEGLYGGRVGLKANTAADLLLKDADVVITVGYNPIEFDVDLWNADGKARKIIHVDTTAAELENYYVPYIEVKGHIAGSIQALSRELQPLSIDDMPGGMLLDESHATIREARERHADDDGVPVHPLRLVSDLQKLLDGKGGDNVSIYLDMGTHHIFCARYLEVHNPRQVCISNGQQTMGVSMPWAISAAFDARDPGTMLQHEWSDPIPSAREVSKRQGFPTDKRIISLSGDGGFLYCAQELETAVRNGLNFVHIVWVDGALDMVKVQQEKKYGHEYGVALGRLDDVKFAESFGAHGFHIEKADDFLPTLERALELKGPVVMSVDVDYSHNQDLFRDSIDMERFH